MAQDGTAPRPTDDPRFDTAMAMLDGGAKLDDVTTALGVPRRTLQRWRKCSRPDITPKAAEEVRRAQHAALTNVAQALALVAEEALKSVRTLVEIRDAKATPEADRIRASIALLDRAGIVGGLKLEHAPSTTAPADRSTLLEELECDVGARAQGEQAQR